MKETVQVTREDREAAAALVPLCFGASALWQKNVLAGYYDDGEVVQAFARHRLSATSAPAGVEGWKLVPVEPTEDMLDAWSCVAGYSNDAELVCGYAAMVAAAPAPSGQEVVHCKTCGERMDSEGIPCADCAFSARTATPPASGVTVPEGMKAWNGGESAPEDWDGGPVLMVDPSDDRGDAFVEVNVPPREMPWKRAAGWKVIVAYTPKPAALSTPSATPGEDHEIMARELLKGAVMRRDATGASMVKHDREGEVDVGAAVDAITVAIRTKITATQGALDPATVERCAQVADAFREQAEELSRRDGATDARAMASLAGEEVAARIRILATDPHQHGGKGA